MDHTRDNPLKRFKAFWIANLLVFSFGVALILLRPLTHMDSDSATDVTAQARWEVKKEVDSAQKAALAPEALQAALAEQAKGFAGQAESKGAMPLPSATPPAAAAGDKPAAEGESKDAPAESE